MNKISQLDHSVVVEHEERLSAAMLNSDLAELDALLDDQLLFTNHLGQIISKRDDINMHRAGVISIERLVASDMQVRVIDDHAIVSVKTEINGTFNSESFASTLRFTRVWSTDDSGSLKVIAAHSSEVV